MIRIRFVSPIQIRNCQPHVRFLWMALAAIRPAPMARIIVAVPVTAELNRQLEGWEYTYNYIRPRLRLDLLAPCEYDRRWKRTQKTRVSRIC
jgi:hypothetical protein